MEKRFNFLGLCLVALCLAACKKTETDGGTGIVLTAHMDDSPIVAKTTLLNSSQVRWSESDAITVLGSGKYYHSISTSVSNEGKLARFTMPAGTEGSFALYPKNEKATYSTDKLHTTLTAVQKSVRDGFADGVNLAASRFEGEDLFFQNAGALLSLKLNDDNISRISLRASDGSAIAGDCLLEFGKDGKLVLAAANTGSSDSVTLEGEFVNGGTYCFVVFPGTYKGLDITVTNNLGQSVSLHNANTISVDRNSNVFIADLPELKDKLTAKPVDVGLDFSYAGYNHGESAPAERSIADLKAAGYRICNAKTEGKLKADGSSSDRKAFIAWLGTIFTRVNSDSDLRFQNKSGKTVIYFPEGTYELQGDNDEDFGKTIFIEGNDIILKGDGRDKTILRMSASNEQSKKVLLSFKNQSGNAMLSKVTSDSPKGEKSVTVESELSLKAGDWVLLELEDKSQAAIEAEFNESCPYDSQWTEFTSKGVMVKEYHQIASVDGNRITFKEPLMHAVNKNFNWKIKSYPHYSGLGIEDLCFEGNQPDGYDIAKHLSAAYDEAYKLLNFSRIVNGWIRRVDFVNVSEAATLMMCANVSVYDINISGNIGHSAIRSQESTRVFIGKVRDSAGNGRGQFHSVGVSKPSIGTVIWRCSWGSETCFESHASQPRATLIDACEGGWNKMRQGGALSSLPNHMQDLVIWNFNATGGDGGAWDWWNYGTHTWKFLQPVIVGFHGLGCTFSNATVVSNGTSVVPESLYESQLRARIGSLWTESIQ